MAMTVQMHLCCTGTSSCPPISVAKEVLKTKRPRRYGEFYDYLNKTMVRSLLHRKVPQNETPGEHSCFSAAISPLLFTELMN